MFNINHIQKIRTIYELKDNFFLDSGAIIHVCNTLSRFTNFRSGTGSVMTGDLIFEIEAWGIINIKVQTSIINKTIILKDVAYIPIFYINLISFKKALAMGFYWNTKIISWYGESPDGG